jgi:hypothetical protein
MKCIQCGTDNKLKDRTANQGQCSKCNHAFVFEPTAMGAVKITDPFFAKAIADISVNNTLFFTPKQLLYLLDERLKGKEVSILLAIILYLSLSVGLTGPVGTILSFFIGKNSFLFVLVGFNLFCIYSLYITSNSPTSSRRVRRSSINSLMIIGIFISIAGSFFSFSFDSTLGFVLTAVLGLSAIWLSFFQRLRANQIAETLLINTSQMEGWLENWQRVNGAVTKMLPSPSSFLSAATPEALPNSEVSAYSFDRLVVCQSDEIAQMLISNNFHFENNCAILSISGYPQRIFATTMEMLRRNPELKVYAFHDCSPEGMELVNQLRTNPRWFPDGNIVVIDVGLLPRQILASKRGVFVQNSKISATAAQNLAALLRQNLSNSEIKWLNKGNFVDLESFTPQKLIQVLQRSIANSQQLDRVDESDLILVGGGSSFFYTSDSFG